MDKKKDQHVQDTEKALKDSSSEQNVGSSATSLSSKIMKLKQILEGLENLMKFETIDTDIQSALNLSKAPEVFNFSQRIYDDIEDMRKLHSAEIVGLENVMNIRGIMKTICKQYKSVIVEISKFCIGILGEPPCKFALVGLGAIAQEDITLHSDFKSVIIVENRDRTVEDYFMQFKLLLEILLLCICSHELRLSSFEQSIDVWNDLSTSWIHIDISSEMLKRFFTPTCFVYGDKVLFSKFHGLEKEKKLKLKGKKIFQDVLNEFKCCMEASTGSSKIATDPPFYKLTSLFLSYIGIYFGIKEVNLFDIVEKLHMENILQEEAANNMKYLVANVCFQRCVFYGNEEGRSNCSLEELRSILAGYKEILELFLSKNAELADLLCKSNMIRRDNKKVVAKGHSSISCCDSSVSAFMEFLKLYNSVYLHTFISLVKRLVMPWTTMEMVIPRIKTYVFELQCNYGVAPSLKLFDKFKKWHIYQVNKQKRLGKVPHMKYDVFMKSLLRFGEMALQNDGCVERKERCKEKLNKLRQAQIMLKLQARGKSFDASVQMRLLTDMEAQSDFIAYEGASKDINTMDHVVVEYISQYCELQECKQSHQVNKGQSSGQRDSKQKEYELKREFMEDHEFVEEVIMELYETFLGSFQDAFKDKEISDTTELNQSVSGKKEKKETRHQKEAQENKTACVKKCSAELPECNLDFPEECLKEDQYATALDETIHISRNRKGKRGLYDQKPQDKVHGEFKISVEGTLSVDFKEENFCDITRVHQRDHDDFQQKIHEKARKKLAIGVNGELVKVHGCVLDFPQGALIEDKELEISVNCDPSNFPKTGRAITPVVGCKPSIQFQKPVTITMTTFNRAKADPVPVQVMRRKKIDDEWKVSETIWLKDENKIQFNISHISEHLVVVPEKYAQNLDKCKEEQEGEFGETASHCQGDKKLLEDAILIKYKRLINYDVIENWKSAEIEKRKPEVFPLHEKPIEQPDHDLTLLQEACQNNSQECDKDIRNLVAANEFTKSTEKQEQRECTVDFPPSSLMENQNITDVASNCGPSCLLKNECQVDDGSMQSKNVLEEELGQKTKTNKIIGIKGGEIELDGILVSFPPEAVKEETKFEISVDTNLSKLPEDNIAITPVLGCLPSMKFDVPVTVTMRTFCSAVEGEEVLAKILYKEEDTDQWTTLHELCLGQENLVQFEVPDFCKYCTLVSSANKSCLEYHLMNDVFIHKDSALICSIFYKCLQSRKTFEQSMEKMSYQLVERPDDCIACVGTKITMKMRRCNPDVDMGENHFMVTAQGLKKEKNTFYFKKLQNLEQFEGIIELSYTTLQSVTGGILPQDIPIHVKWPISHRKESSTQGGITITADTVATDQSTIHHSSTNSTHHVTGTQR